MLVVAVCKRRKPSLNDVAMQGGLGWSQAAKTNMETNPQTVSKPSDNIKCFLEQTKEHVIRCMTSLCGMDYVAFLAGVIASRTAHSSTRTGPEKGEMQSSSCGRVGVSVSPGCVRCTGWGFARPANFGVRREP
eukprot:972407-Amphidinium_carterae.1